MGTYKEARSEPPRTPQAMTTEVAVIHTTVQDHSKAIKVTSAVRNRVARALDRKQEVTQHGDLYIVNGETGNYTVNLDHDAYGETCTCMDWRINAIERGLDHTCKHQYAATLYCATHRG